MKMRFEWDTAKVMANLRKHGVSFETATRVFSDPYALFAQDRIVDGEQRRQAIGVVDGLVMLMVAHIVLEREGVEGVRII